MQELSNLTYTKWHWTLHQLKKWNVIHLKLLFKPKCLSQQHQTLNIGWTQTNVETGHDQETFSCRNCRKGPAKPREHSRQGCKFQTRFHCKSTMTCISCWESLQICVFKRLQSINLNLKATKSLYNLYSRVMQHWQKSIKQNKNTTDFELKYCWCRSIAKWKVPIEKVL